MQTDRQDSTPTHPRTLISFTFCKYLLIMYYTGITFVILLYLIMVTWFGSDIFMWGWFCLTQNTNIRQETC
jgi:hypothetical protein